MVTFLQRFEIAYVFTERILICSQLVMKLL